MKPVIRLAAAMPRNLLRWIEEKRINSMFARIIVKRKDQPGSLVWSGVALLGQGRM